MDHYPPRCKRNIRTLCERLCTDDATAYSMLLMTAALMDLKPEDDKTVKLVLEDCGVFPQQNS